MHHPVDASFQGCTLRGDILETADPTQLLVLHGAGLPGRVKFRRLRDSLLSHGIASAAFDFIGHGDTGGNLDGSSLASRTEQATEFVRSTALAQPFAIFGSSMSGYTAVKLTEIFSVHTLILSVPAMYDRSAYHVPFGPDFSAVLRQPESWRKSDAWEILRNFKGRVLMISAELDSVIPKGVLDLISESCISASSFEKLVLQGEEHRFEMENPAICGKLSESIVHVIRGTG